jgi:DNA replication protein DnaC
LTTFKDQRHSEKRKTNCEQCGLEIEYSISFDRSGQPWGVKPKLCKDCKAKTAEAIKIKELKEHLSEVIKDTRIRWFEEIDIPGIFIDKASDGYEKFEKSLQPKAYDAITKFDGHSIVLSSPEIYGVGKTHLVCCLIWYLLDHTEAASVNDYRLNYSRYSCPAQFTTETALLARIRATYDHHEQKHETEEDVFKYFAKFHVLVIDDVGKVRPKDYSFLQSVYFRIIDDRYVSEQAIVLTTNLSLKDLENHIGGACADRLKEMCGKGNIIRMEGKSYRAYDK